MIYIIWLVLLSLFVFSFLNPDFPVWIPVLAYLLVVGVRVKEKNGNYKDWVEKIIVMKNEQLTQTYTTLKLEDVHQVGCG